MFIIIFAYLTFGLLFLTFFTSIFCLKNKVTEGGQKEREGRERGKESQMREEISHLLIYSPKSHTDTPRLAWNPEAGNPSGCPM